MSNKPKKIFVVGHPRSGTTLLAAVIGRNDLVESTPESQFFCKVQYALASKKNKNAADVVNILKQTDFKDWHIDFNSLEKTLKKSTALDNKSILNKLFDIYAKNHNVEYVLEKSPIHIRHIDQILDIDNSAKIIWILRDSRPCVGSLQKCHWATNNVAMLSIQWNVNISFGLYFLSKYPDNVLLIKYEDLLSEPDEILTKIHDFIGIKYNLLQKMPNDKQNVIMPFEIEWKKNINNSFMPERAVSWKNEMKKEDIKMVTILTNKLLNRFKYTDQESYYSISGFFTFMLSKASILFLLRNIYEFKEKKLNRNK